MNGDSDSSRVDCALCQCNHHMIGLSILHAGLVNLHVFKTTVDDIEWSDSKRVDCVLCKPQWMMLTGQTVGGLIVNCADTFTPWYHCRLHSRQWILSSGHTVGGLK